MTAQILEALTPLVFLALGGLISEQAGILNISLEGCLLGGSFAAILVLLLTGSLPLALAAAAAAGLALGALAALVILPLGSNPFIAGLGINLLTPALAALVTQALYGHRGILTIPGGLPSPPSFLGLSLPVWGVLPGAGLCSWLLYRTDFGRRLRGAGERPEFLRERGIPPQRTQMTALLISSGMAAFTGGLLAFRVGAWVPGMSAGRGWIALVVIWLGLRKPWGILGAAALFAFAEVLAQRSQGALEIPETLLLAFPYIIALGALTQSTRKPGLWRFKTQADSKKRRRKQLMSPRDK